MNRRILKNKPLVEAIFELRWELQDTIIKRKIDPHYKLLIGRAYEKVKEEYPFHEQLPTANIPDELASYIVQHRFRKDKNRWPLIQIGPGIITLNDTDGYIWEDFEKRISNLIDTIFEVYPEPGNLKVNELILRYIDAIDFEYKKGDIFNFLKEHMKMNIEIHRALFEDTGVGKFPLDFNLNFDFSSKNPKGIIHLKFIRGKRNERDALIWETILRSTGEDAPKDKDKITTWVNEAHELTVYHLFFKIIEGELERRFE